MHGSRGGPVISRMASLCYVNILVVRAIGFSLLIDNCTGNQYIYEQ